MEKQQKIYCGSGKKKSETWFQVTLNPKKFSEYIQEYNGTEFIKLNINVGKPDKYGKDVQVTIDTWKPEAKSEPKGNTFVQQNSSSDLPF